MADYRPFGYEGEPQTCLWCGRKLHYKDMIVDSSRRGEPGVTWHLGNYATARADKPGGYQDGHFCGLRCGYQFGVRLADIGRRLEKIRMGEVGKT